MRQFIRLVVAIGACGSQHEKQFKYVKADYYDGFYAGEGQQQPGQAYLKELEQLTKSKWRAVIVEPYMD